MHGKLTLDLGPVAGNPRNSEGSFSTLADGSVLFAYSRFCGKDGGDDSQCDIAVVLSHDNGDSWSEPSIIAYADDFGVDNLMSVSTIKLDDGVTGILFCVKTLEGNIDYALARTSDGVNFDVGRCNCDFIPGYYVLNNDRVERLSDGRIILPVAYHRLQSRPSDHRILRFDGRGEGMIFASDDNLKSIHQLKAVMPLGDSAYSDTGIQEPGLVELKNGSVWVYARTDCGSQYESFSYDGLKTLTPARRSRFTSPPSPMKVKRNPFTGELVAVWNPIPNYNGRTLTRVGWGRTPLVIARSADDGVTWSGQTVLEDDPERGYCYPALHFIDRDTMLVGYCRGGSEDSMCLARLGIQKLKIDF